MNASILAAVDRLTLTQRPRASTPAATTLSLPCSSPRSPPLPSHCFLPQTPFTDLRVTGANAARMQLGGMGTLEATTEGAYYNSPIMAVMLSEDTTLPGAKATFYTVGILSADRTSSVRVKVSYCGRLCRATACCPQIDPVRPRVLFSCGTGGPAAARAASSISP